MSPAVALRGAAVDVGGRRVWTDVDVTVEPGEFVAVLGPNGAGKSTLLKIVLGAVALRAGTATVLGTRPGAQNARIGYLPQRRAFDGSIRIRGRDIVRLGVDGDRWGVPLLLGRRERARRARIDEVVDLVSASAYADRPIGACSGGEQQRLLIAQALARRPDLLILDEPLDSLDIANQVSVSALLRDVCRSEGVAVLIVAHDVNPLLAHLDRVVHVADGTAVQGRPADVITVFDHHGHA